MSEDSVSHFMYNLGKLSCNKNKAVAEKAKKISFEFDKIRNELETLKKFKSYCDRTKDHVSITLETEHSSATLINVDNCILLNIMIKMIEHKLSDFIVLNYEFIVENEHDS